MDRQRAAIIGTAAALVVIVVFTVGFVMGRASTGDGSSAGGGPGAATDSNGMPAGPSRMDDGVPLGFAQSEAGAISAAVSWLPWLLSSPAAERPDGMDDVLAAGVEPPLPEGFSERIQFAVWAAGAEMTSSEEATVTLWGHLLHGDPGGDLEAGIWPLVGRLVWDDNADDWRVAEAEFDEGPIDEPTASDVRGLRVVRFTGGLLAGPVIEEVPGD